MNNLNTAFVCATYFKGAALKQQFIHAAVTWELQVCFEYF